MQVTIRNDFHNTQTTIRPTRRGNSWRINLDQIKRAKSKLCGTQGCTCSDRLGSRGPQEYDIAYDGFEVIDITPKAANSTN